MADNKMVLLVLKRIGEKIEEMFIEEIASPGGVRNTLKKYLNTEKSL